MDAETTAALLILTQVLAWISLACNLFLIVAYSCDPNSRKFPSRVFLYSLGSCVLINIAICLNTLADNPFNNPNSIECQAQGFLLYYGYISWNIWVLILSIDLFIVVGRSRVILMPRLAEALMIVAAWGVPLIPAVTMLVLGYYSRRDLWCSVSYTSFNLALGTFWIPSLILVVLAEVFFALLIVRLVKSVKKAGKKAENESWRKAIFRTAQRMIIFLFFYGIINVSRSALRFSSIAQGKSSLDTTGVVFYTIFTNISGILHMAVFGSTKAPYTALRRTIVSSHVSNNEELGS